MLAVEKRLQSPLLEPSSVEKIMAWSPSVSPCADGPQRCGWPVIWLDPCPQEIDAHIGCAMSGLTADARTLLDHARAETQVQLPLSPRRCCC